ncbi:MAG TPA: manganese catalase family protein [Clostridiaceae bacterium]|nr:manganese catalase family protein [Clostridiaceae bacterium]
MFFTHQATSLGANELAHLEMVGSLVHQLTEGVTIEELEKAGLSAYYTDHGVGLEYIQIRI